ncbi:MAG: ROK family protein [Candidatus Saccharibacteria bacterium]
MKWSIGADIGYTNIRVVRVANGVVTQALNFPTDVKSGPSGIARQVFSAVSKLREDEERPPEGLGVGIAGQCDIRSGVVKSGPNLWWNDEPFEGTLADMTGLSTVLRNDVVMATMGEWKHGAGSGSDNVATLFVGTGIGGGAVVDGRLLDGATGCAGHFGHVSVDLDGPVCTCGRKGCVEAYAGGWAVARRAQEALTRDMRSSELLHALSKGGVDTVDCRMVAEAAHRGDRLALEIRDEMARALSSAVASVINSLNPEKVVLGGTVLNGFPALREMVAEGALRACLKPVRKGLSIVPSSLGDLAGSIGAATMVMEKLG